MKPTKNQNTTIATILILTTITTILTTLILLTLTSNQTSAGQQDSAVTEVEVGNVYPEVNTTIESDVIQQIDLVANENTTVNCTAIIVDYNGEDDIYNVNATFYDTNNSWGGSSDDNNYHYSTDNCTADRTYGDGNELYANCEFNVTYYSNNKTWVCEVVAEDYAGFKGLDNDTIDINDLIALEIPATIDFGVVDAFTVSWENMTNVTNVGNVPIDINLDGYADYDGDGRAMTCTAGYNKYISIEHEKYNTTESNPQETMTFDNVNNLYLNLTDSPILADISTPQRWDDTQKGNGDFNNTYWRIYIPEGVAGTCQGNITFSAIVG